MTTGPCPANAHRQSATSATTSLLAEIARGGMGVVYKARQVNLNRIVALKMILAGQLASTDDVQRFYTEAEAAANLDHPGIVPIYRSRAARRAALLFDGLRRGREPGRQSVRAAHCRRARRPSSPRRSPRPLPTRTPRGHSPRPEAGEHPAGERRGRRASRRRGQFAAHDPRETYVSRSPNASPRSPTLAWPRRSKPKAASRRPARFSARPVTCPPSRPPARASRSGRLADVYSLGAILYCLLTGRPPFQAASPLDTLLQVLGEEPVAPRQLNPQAPRDLETICLKCLQKDAGQTVRFGRRDWRRSWPFPARRADSRPTRRRRGTGLAVVPAESRRGGAE